MLGVGLQIKHNAAFNVFGLIFIKMNIKKEMTGEPLESASLIPVFETAKT